VVKTHLDLKLTNQLSKDLSLSAGVKYDERDNRTPSNAYTFSSIAGDPYSGVVNAPVSDRKTQLELAGTYRIDKKQSAQFAYEHEAIRRWCNNLLPSPDPTNANGTYDPTTGLGLFTTTPYTNSACVLSPESNENKISTSYKLKASDTVILKASYTYASRVASISSFYNPMQANPAGFENQGFAAYYNGSRTEQLFKAGADWQTSDKSNVGLSGRYVDDQYNATLGVQKIQTWSLNLDAAYDYSHDGNVSAYLTTQWRQRDLLSSAQSIPAPTAANDLWTNRLTDDSNTIGVKAKQKGLMSGKLELIGDLSYSLAKSGYSTQTTNCTDASGVCGTPGVNSGTLPDIKNEILKLKVTGNYHIDKVSKVAFGYRFQKQTTNDYYYGAYQTGYTDPGVLPTNQQAPNYTINVLSISYGYSF
jgi:MtrB/PioB family decaheme-associated outer membrane protein